MTEEVSRETPPLVDKLFPRAAARLSAYADLLATEGSLRGLIGPREVPRLWDRHLLNCAVVERLIPEESSVADIGTGAGLPGIVLAIVRPDLHVDLVEPLLRRTTFLQEAVDALELDNARVVRARAEDLPPASYDIVTSRAVAPLAKLARWCLPLCVEGGLMLAMKGSSAEEELDGSERELMKLGAEVCHIHQLGGEELAHPTTVVSIVAGRAAGGSRHGRHGR
ncbi:16S rRNA (guanine(527)-N(7))-methyltransferase RsmG [Kribbella jejuensis]|uniref:Ribosomal RNA small subunit methyltransferase G n=1 Tax=Kribbella jejuensis TaxID=236068 RepID=A0A542EUW4_9ACTN|nr:16S rRNA (guanine(527)-N(7))-methyltransferase RsmG [Kribbella jejuensis]TQJ18974.1 16S rRNA (guanine527-N7)-methyltransferase [Kribbella jejuensis]